MVGTVIRRLLLAGCLALTGCAFPTGGKSTFCLPCSPPTWQVEANLYHRGIFTADAPPPELNTVGAEPMNPAGYRILTAEECQCLAVEHATTAHLVDIERQLAIASTPPRPQSRMARGLRVHRRLLELRAAQIRNDAAGQALETYYQLAAAEAMADILARTSAHLNQMMGRIVELRTQGLQPPLDELELRRQEIDLLRRQAELDWTIAQLNGQLRLLLGWDINGPVRAWPQADFIVTETPVNVEAAVQAGLSSRPDLATLRLLDATLDEATIPVVRGALQTQDASLGNVTSGFERLGQLLRPARGDDELAARRAQLRVLLAEKERELVVGVVTAAGAVEMRRDQAQLAKLAFDNAVLRLRDLQQLRNIGQATPADVSAQEGEVLEAEGEFLQAVAQWRLAEVKLRQTLGVLVWECIDHAACPP